MSTQAIYNAGTVQTADEVLAEHEQRRRDHAAMQARHQRTDELMARIQTRMLLCLGYFANGEPPRTTLSRNDTDAALYDAALYEFVELAKALAALNRY